MELLNEGTRVFAPVSALHLGGRYYKVLELDENRKDSQTLRFEAGKYVLCLLTELSEENLVPLAYCEVTKEEAEYMSFNLNS